MELLFTIFEIIKFLSIFERKWMNSFFYLKIKGNLNMINTNKLHIQRCVQATSALHLFCTNVYFSNMLKILHLIIITIKKNLKDY